MQGTAPVQQILLAATYVNGTATDRVTFGISFTGTQLITAVTVHLGVAWGLLQRNVFITLTFVYFSSKEHTGLVCILAYFANLHNLFTAYIVKLAKMLLTAHSVVIVGVVVMQPCY